ncbi:hypothetical protein ICL16_08570 [Iningainema sp. BLCCT55]|uniref:Uncharacterized protein n=1 Tax=Iningainema tapete BLCC-T55 TaxID=2748662 RepID=A0A8J6XEB8_9CYAN|nr:hypothetical protein [Iningainema tapete BLCC-T55]
MNTPHFKPILSGRNRDPRPNNRSSYYAQEVYAYRQGRSSSQFGQTLIPQLVADR